MAQLTNSSGEVSCAVAVAVAVAVSVSGSAVPTVNIAAFFKFGEEN
jgi:hypothetical protein